MSLAENARRLTRVAPDLACQTSC